MNNVVFYMEKCGLKLCARSVNEAHYKIRWYITFSEYNAMECEWIKWYELWYNSSLED